MKEPEENIVYAKKIRDQLYLRLMRFHVSMQTSSQDTDSFIIGQRVYVDGVKPGRIQFIGETKFGKLANFFSSDVISLLLPDLPVTIASLFLIIFSPTLLLGPGEWSGVFLDEPIGKNDGSVRSLSSSSRFHSSLETSKRSLGAPRESRVFFATKEVSRVGDVTFF